MKHKLILLKNKISVSRPLKRNLQVKKKVAADCIPFKQLFWRLVEKSKSNPFCSNFRIKLPFFALLQHIFS